MGIANSVGFFGEMAWQFFMCCQIVDPAKSFLPGAIGLIMGSYPGTDPALVIKSDFGVSKYFKKFETHRQWGAFEDLLKNIPGRLF